MKVSGPISQPFRFRSHGEQPVSRVCRHFVNMGSAVESPLVGEQKIWWTRFGGNFSPDILPDEYILVTDKSMLSDAVQEVDSPINPPDNRVKPLPADCMLAEQNEQKHRLAQVHVSFSDGSFSDGQCLDRSETLQDQSTHRYGGSVLEEPTNHGCLSADTDSVSSDGESHPQSMLLATEFHCGNPRSEEALEASASARVKVMCSFGGRIMPRPVDGKLRYVGGETRIIAVNKHTSFSDFMSKMAELYGAPLGLKYQLPDEDLDALVSVSSEDDLQNMMEEYDKVASCGSASRLRLFFFLTPAEIQVCETKTDGEEGCPFPDQQYVDAINGVSGKFHVTLSEDDMGAIRQVDEGNTVEGNGRTTLFEHANELSQSKGTSAPSSSPSSPSLASHQAPCHKPPGLVDFSLQTLHDRLNKVTMAPHILEGASEHEGSGKFSSMPFHRHNDQHQYDQQYSLHADSPQVVHHELQALRGESRSDFRHFDSQFARQSEQFPEYWMNGGGPTDHWHDMHISQETVLPHGEHQRIFPQLKQSACVQQPPLPPPPHYQQQQQHHHHHKQVVHHHHHQQQPKQQQQQGWSPPIDGDSGRAEQAQHDMHKQQQVIHQPQTLHHLHHNLSMHDRCSWNAEYHGQSVEHNPVPPFIHGSSQINPQILHGLAPVPPYQIGSAPPSPRLGLYDFQGKCSCGLQHSQVHRGITVSIGEQSHNRWPPHYGDHAVRKQGFRNSPRFYDGASHATDSPMWQNTSHTNYTPETDHRDVGSHWHHYMGRHTGDFHLADSQTRSRALQYSEYPVHEGNFRPIHERPADTNMRCLCSSCTENRRQPVEMTIGHSAYSEVPAVVPEWVLHRKGFDPDAGRLSSARRPFPRVPVYKEEDQRGDHANDRFTEGESGLFVPQQLPGDSESRRTMGSHVDGMHHGRKLTYPSGALPNKFLASDEPSVHQLSGQQDWYPSSKAFVELPRNRSEVNLHPHKQNSTRLIEVGNTSLSHEISRTNLASSSPVVMEDIDSSDRVALLSDSQPHNYGAFAPQSFCREESCIPGTEGVVIGVAPLHSLATSGLQFVDVSCSSPMIAAGCADNHLLSPDVIPLGHVSSTTQSGQAVPASVPVACNLQQANTAPIYEQRLSNSGNVIKFSFAGPDKTKLPPLEANTDNKPLPSNVSAMEISADGTIPSVLESGVNKELSHEIPKAILEVEYTDSPKVLKDQAISRDVTSLNTLKSPVLEQEVSTLNDITVGNQCVEAITETMIHTVQNEELTNTSHQERVSEAGALGKDRNMPSLSQAEAEAISHGLQIIKNSDLEDLKELGSGTYGTVYHGKWRGSDVAIKRIKASCFNGPPSERERLISDFWREACTLGQLHHPNVVAFYGVVPDGPGGTLATVTEYMVNGSLKQVLHKKDRTIDRRKRLFIAMDAAFGMEYLHSKNIVHFDLKCENLLVNMRDAHRPICKVGDFGLSKVKHHTLVSGGVRGTLPWMAPELLSGNSSMVSEKVDVFSFGIVMWELLTGEEPYENMHCGAIIGGIVNDTLRPSIPSWCDPGWRSLMERCWSRNPADRPAFTEVARELRAIAATMNLK